MRVHPTGKEAVVEASSGMRWDEALRSVGIQLQTLTFKEHGSRKQNRIPVGNQQELWGRRVERPGEFRITPETEAPEVPSLKRAGAGAIQRHLSDLKI